MFRKTVFHLIMIIVKSNFILNLDLNVYLIPFLLFSICLGMVAFPWYSSWPNPDFIHYIAEFRGEFKMEINFTFRNVTAPQTKMVDSLKPGNIVTINRAWNRCASFRLTQ